MRALVRLRRACIWLALAAAAWAGIVALAGGFSLAIDGIRISSRNPRNPALVALICVALTWTLGRHRRRNSEFLSEWRAVFAELVSHGSQLWRLWRQCDRALATHIPRTVAPIVVCLTVAIITWVAFARGALVAAGSDAAGYASQAQLWAEGKLKAEPPLMRELTAQIPRDAFAPLAWIPFRNEPAIVPVTGPGLPLIMALFRRIAGEEGLFSVVPLLGGVAILATYFLGSAFESRWVGLASAVLLACSPSFLFQLTSSPMSDIPATVWWTLALGFAIRSARHGAMKHAFLSGLFSGFAILTRPNLVPITLVPAALLLIDRPAWRPQLRRLASFGLGVSPAPIVVAWLFNYWYGSPLASGYGTVSSLYRWANFLPNLERYPLWIAQSQTPVVALGIVAPLLMNRFETLTKWRGQRAAAVALLMFALAVLSCYVWYAVFDVWWFVRFLLPAFPALLVLTTVSLFGILERAVPTIRTSVAIIVCAVISWHGLRFAEAASAFNVSGEWKYEAAGRYVADHLPAKVVILANQHSGSAWYYTRRTTVRYSALPAQRLDWLVSAANSRGYEVYLLAEDYEQREFLERFAGAGTAAPVSRAPAVKLTSNRRPSYDVRLYRLSLH